MAWTSAQDLRAQTQKLWDKGALLSELIRQELDHANGEGQAQGVVGESFWPKRLRLLGPTTAELTARFEEVRNWAEGLRSGAKNYRLLERDIRSPVLGHNRIPDEAWLDTLPSALALIGKTQEAARFTALVRGTQARQALLLPWLEKRPHVALGLEPVLLRLFSVVAWLQAHPRPGIYLRQVDIAGVDSKFIKLHRGVLAELLDLALPAEAIDRSATGVAQFCQRYSFKDKPLRIRLRWLEPSVAGYGTDVTITQTAFEQLTTPVRRVFVTENEVNFLAFPDMPNSMVIFGGGFGGLNRLRSAAWLHQRSVFYWGDIDTHGYAMLDQLRSYLPHAQSVMMDSDTLTQHADHWGHEPQAQQRDLPRLNVDERVVYDALRDNRIRPGLRLEQERIGFAWVQQALAALPV